ncbi:MAG: carbohydrate kinase family protein [Pseudomonadota bacterium]
MRLLGSPVILSAGRVYCDLVFAGLDAPVVMGREVFADALQVCTGGGAFISAAYLSALGQKVGLLGVLPAEPFSGLVQADLAASAIHPYCTVAPGRDAQLTAAIVGAVDRAFITRRVGRAVPQAMIDGLPPARHLHIGELTTALEHPDLITAARSRGMTISLDCGWDETSLARRDLGSVIASVDLFLPNENEAEALMLAGTSLAPRLATVIKRGADGATCITDDGDSMTVSAQPVTVVDTTGAGDAFNAGFLSAWCDGQTLDEALALGAACGAVAVSRLGGATNLPDLRNLAASHGHHEPLRQMAE